MLQGGFVRIELVSSDLTTAAPLGLYSADGEAVELGDHERLLIAELTFALEGAANQLITLYAGTGSSPSTGERLVAIRLDATEGSTEHIQYDTERQCGHPGIVPRVHATQEGAVTVTGVGYIVKASSGEGARQSWREDVNA